jgi:EAL domain-containing protein (putative c-di-GMP-specific phosphodiesterase class I)/FixJ family two-component response regulator
MRLDQVNTLQGVLVVDDEPFIRSLSVKLLKELGCEYVLGAADGREAVAILQNPDNKIDLVVCDLMMPDMDGIEAVRHIAALPHRPAIAFLSGAEPGLLRAAESLARAYRMAVLPSISKPATRNAFQAVLHGVESFQSTVSRKAAHKVSAEDLARGIDRGELSLHFQPKVTVSDQKLSSVEALVRWNHPHHGLLSPDSFVPLAEKTGLIGPMTERVVEIGLAQFSGWLAQGMDFKMALNLSPSMLADVQLPDRYARKAEALNIPLEKVILEITETGVANEETIYLEIVTRLHMKGFHLSIDDFGTGQSSLQKLEALPFSELKVDRQFVHMAHASSAKRAILSASLSLARAMQLSTVAEGVEHGEDLQLLRDLGCDVVQGFVISRPLAPEAFQTWAQGRAKMAPIP